MKLADLRNLKTPKQIIAKYVSIQSEYPSYIWCLCPFHKEDRPSCAISLSTGKYRCRSCGKTGPFQDISKEKVHEPVKAYIYRDKVGRPLYINLRYFPKSFAYFTIRGDDLLPGLSVGRVPYNFHLLHSGLYDRIFLVEGEKDADSLTARGFLGTTSGGSQTINQDFGRRLKETGLPVSAIPDNDKPVKGRETGAQIWLKRVGEFVHPQCYLSVPDENRDITDFLEKGGKLSELKEKRVEDGMYQTGTELLERAEKFPPLIPTGIARLDAVGALRERGILVLGGRTGMGKTSFLSQIIYNLLPTRKCLVLPYEESAHIFMARLFLHARLISGISESLVPDSAIRERLKNLLVLKHPSTDIRKLKAQLNYTLEKEKPDIVCIDHLQELHGGSGAGSHLDLVRVIQMLRDIHRDFPVTLLLAAQLNRSNQGDRIPPPPRLSELRGSGTIEEVCTGILLMHRPSYYDKNADPMVHILVDKNRYGPSKLDLTFPWNGEKLGLDLSK